MSSKAAGIFEAETVVTLRVINPSRRLEIKLANSHGTEHIVSLPLSSAIELSTFITDVSAFLSQLEKDNGPLEGE